MTDKLGFEEISPPSPRLLPPLPPHSSEEEVELLGVKDDQSMGSMPHARYTCPSFKFKSGDNPENNEKCSNCYCYVCDIPANKCELAGTWTNNHSNAYDDRNTSTQHWFKQRRQNKDTNKRKRSPSPPPVQSYFIREMYGPIARKYIKLKQDIWHDKPRLKDWALVLSGKDDQGEVLVVDYPKHPDELPPPYTIPNIDLSLIHI